MARRGEFEQIAEVFAPLTRGAAGALALGDDGAVLSVPAGCDLVVTTDTIVAGVHFLPDDPPDLVAQKLVRVNLSDLAAMGADPFGLFAACAFPRGTTDAWAEAFATGLGRDVEEFGVPLLGGDTVATPGAATFTMTALGTVPSGQALTRRGARNGDLIAVTGTLGDAAFGLRAAQGRLRGVSPDAAAWLADRYRVPQPRTALAPRLRGLVTSCMDISDGLVQDLEHICRASRVGAEIEAATLPLSEAMRDVAQREGDWLTVVLGGGDDYELVMTVAPERREALYAAAAVAGVRVTVIGRCVAAEGVSVLDDEGRRLNGLSTGFRHF